MVFKSVMLIFSTLSVALFHIFLMHNVKKKHRGKKLLLTKEDTNDYHIIFTTVTNIDCMMHIRNNLTCGENCSNVYLNDILTVLSAAKKSISLCMYHLTLESIHKLILEAHRRNVIVRIITDNEMTFATGSKIKSLKRNGVKVKIPSKADGLCHHKFCLIDEHSTEVSRILFGSMNFSLHAVCSNWDHVIITNNPLMITAFSEAFEDMWKTF